MKTVDGIRKCRGLALLAGAAMVAGMAFGEDALCDDSLKELFPWFEIGEVVDAEKAAGLRHFNDFLPKPGVGGRVQYVIANAGLPTNECAYVTLSVPERKVLEMRRDIACATTNEAAARTAALVEKFKPLGKSSGRKALAIYTPEGTGVSFTLSDAEYARKMSAAH